MTRENNYSVISKGLEERLNDPRFFFEFPVARLSDDGRTAFTYRSVEFQDYMERPTNGPQYQHGKTGKK